MGRASIGASLQSGADRQKKNIKLKTNNKAVSENKSPHRFFYILMQTHPAKSASDFAAVEL